MVRKRDCHETYTVFWGIIRIVLMPVFIPGQKPWLHLTFVMDFSVGIIRIILKDLFSWQCQNLCWLSLANLTKTKIKTYADIIDWRVVVQASGTINFWIAKTLLYQNYAELYVLPLKSFLDHPPCSKDMETGTARLASKMWTGFATFGKSRRP